MDTPCLILVALADAGLRASVGAALQQHGFAFGEAAACRPRAQDYLRHEPSVVIIDVAGFAALDAGERRIVHQAGVEVLIAHEAHATAEALKAAGESAVDFLEMPPQSGRFEHQVRRVLEIARLRRDLAHLRKSDEADAVRADTVIALRTKERNEAENRAIRLTARLADLERLKSNLITIISHEFKTPLHLAAGYASLLADESSGALNVEQKASVAIIQKQLARLADKLADIERVAQLEMGLKQRLTESVDIGEILRLEIEGFEQACHKKQIIVTADVARDLPPVRGCQDFLADVFRRLLDNAVHYNKDGGRIGVLAARHTDGNGANGVRIQIRDTGAGIAPALLPHIFERFGEFRDVEHHSSHRSGLGLGLPICRHLVEMHDGEITVESVVGTGSTFSVFLPTQS